MAIPRDHGYIKYSSYGHTKWLGLYQVAMDIQSSYSYAMWIWVHIPSVYKQVHQVAMAKQVGYDITKWLWLNKVARTIPSGYGYTSWLWLYQVARTTSSGYGKWLWMDIPLGQDYTKWLWLNQVAMGIPSGYGARQRLTFQIIIFVVKFVSSLIFSKCRILSLKFYLAERRGGH